MMKKFSDKRRKQIIAIGVLVVLILGLGIGFAAFSTQLNILSSAEVTPDSADFSVIFTSKAGSAAEADTTGDLVKKEVVDGKNARHEYDKDDENEIVTARTPIIDNSDHPTIKDLHATFTKPGQKVIYSFYTYNNGQYDAFLTNLTYKDLKTNPGKIKVCTPKTDKDGVLTTQSMVDAACDDINVTISVGGTMFTGTKDSTNHLLTKGNSEEVIVTIEYAENGALADGVFDIAFGDIELIYSTIDDSFATDGTGNISTKEYQMIYNTGGGEISDTEANKTVKYTSTYGELATPSRAGYTFKGWYGDDQYNNAVSSDTVLNTKENPEVFAKWEALKYTVTFNPTTGDLPGGASTTKEVTFGSTYGDLPEPTMTGYTFVGWFTDEEHTKQITSISEVDIANNHTLYADYSAGKYVVTFDPTTGVLPSDASTTKEVYYGRTYGDMPTPTRVGYNFDGWYNSDGTKIQSNTTVNITSAITLTARWTAKNYQVNFDANAEGVTNPTSKSVDYNSQYGELPTLTRPGSGYKFVGWFTGTEEGSQKVTATSIMDSVDGLTLYAHWTEDTFTVTFDANYDNAPAVGTTLTVTYHGEYGTDLPSASRYGYEFKGWWTSATGGSQINSDTRVTITDDQVLYAHWQANSHHVNVTVTSAEGTGTVAPTSFDILFDETKTFTVTPASGFYLKSVTCGGNQVTANTGINYMTAQTVSLKHTVNADVDCTVEFEAGSARSIQYTNSNGLKNPFSAEHESCNNAQCAVDAISEILKS